MELAGEIAAFYARCGDPDALQEAFDRTPLVMAVTSANVPLTLQDRGMVWLCAFTTTEALARFAVARGEGDTIWHHRTATGAELHEAPWPVGVAVDLGGNRPMLFPPAGAGA